MQRVKVITVLAIVTLGAFAILAFSAYRRNRNFILGSKNTDSSKTEADKNDSSNSKIDNNLYIDSSGFSFEYPKEYKILDITPGESPYYSVVEILKEATQSAKTKSLDASISALLIATDSSIPKVKVTVKDGIYEIPKNSEVMDKESFMGKLPAIKYFFKEDKNEMVSLASQNLGILYLIESPKKEEWENILNLVAKTFTLGVFPSPITSPTATPK